MSVRLVHVEARPGEEARAAAEVRALAPAPPAVEEDVRAVVAAVRERGDSAVRELTARFDRADVPPERLRVEPEEIESALRALEPGLRRALETAIANVRAVARASLHEGIEVQFPAGQRVEVVELPVRRAGAYVPGGRAPYASTVVMCAVTAREAGVDELAVCAPPGPGGEAHPTILAACAVCRVAEVYRMGGAQAIAALAYGTETVPPVDVLVGPGSAYVQEAKRQAFGRVGLDGIAGPSELVVVASEGADAEIAALDLLAQAEHGAGSLTAFVTDTPRLLAGLEEALGAAQPIGREGGEAGAATPALAIVHAPDPASAVRIGDLIAPEHMQLMGDEVEALAPEVRTAGALFVGREAATAFGDYVAGSNHVLPTGGAARHASALSVATFRRRMARIHVPANAAAQLAPAGAALARAEGFSLHAESMERRVERQ
ncbi:MAG TPA: histidinol dehydrogenase [Thermoleophilaceae bacterium]|nr:histidinol dehydrogenase [Thermoleophilaceae bacterium]